MLTNQNKCEDSYVSEQILSNTEGCLQEDMRNYAFQSFAK